MRHTKSFMRFVDNDEVDDDDDDFTDDEKALLGSLAKVGLGLAAMIIAGMRGRIDQAHLERIVTSSTTTSGDYQYIKEQLTDLGEKLFNDMVAHDHAKWEGRS